MSVYRTNIKKGATWKIWAKCTNDDGSIPDFTGATIDAKLVDSGGQTWEITGTSVGNEIILSLDDTQTAVMPVNTDVYADVIVNINDDKLFLFRIEGKVTDNTNV